MPLDEIVVLLRWLAAVMTVLVLCVGWAVVMLLNSLAQLSRQLQCAIQQADAGTVSAGTSADAPDGKMPELAPWHDDQTVDDLIARSE